jgi:hypothetical protein
MCARRRSALIGRGGGGARMRLQRQPLTQVPLTPFGSSALGVPACLPRMLGETTDPVPPACAIRTLTSQP